MRTTEYDIVKAFEAIEEELIASMIRNFKRHRADELAEGLTWEMWQSVQLRELDRYRKQNQKRFQKQFEQIQLSIESLLRGSAENGEKTAAEKIEKYKKFWAAKMITHNPDFLKINDQKLTALIEATKADFNMAEMSILRQADDIYRKTIYNAQVYAATGATYEKAVDMATKDFLRAGINCVMYKNGSRHTVPEYAKMALKTGQKRAYLMGEGNARDRYGIHTVRVNSRTDACPKCVKWLNKVLIDDVYSGGTRAEAQALNLPTLSDAIRTGFLHPNCKDVYTTYIEGVSRPADKWTKEELVKIADKYNDAQELQYSERMAESYERMAKYSLDDENKRNYSERAKTWKEKAEEIRNGNRS